MEKLLEYTRLTFEIQTLKENNTFDCTSNSSEKCLCIPGVSANYVLRSLYHCLKCFRALSSMKWEPEDGRYVAECCDKNDEHWFVNFMRDISKCKYGDEICKKREENNLPDAKYAYIKLRSKEELQKKCGVRDVNYRIKNCLLHFDEKVDNKKDYLYLFTYVVKEYYAYSEFNMVDYLDMLFRLYFFLFYDEGKALLVKDCHNMNDAGYFEYIKTVISDYAKLGEIVEKGKTVNINEAIKCLSGYLGIKFETVYNHYSVGMESGDVRELHEIINKQFKCAQNFAEAELSNMLFDLEYCAKGIA